MMIKSNENISFRVERTSLGYMARLRVCVGGRVAWSEASGIQRITRHDARIDGQQMLRRLAQTDPLPLAP